MGLSLSLSMSLGSAGLGQGISVFTLLLNGEPVILNGELLQVTYG